MLERLGADNMFPADDRVLGALDEAVAEGERWIAQQSAALKEPPDNHEKTD